MYHVYRHVQDHEDDKHGLDFGNDRGLMAWEHSSPTYFGEVPVNLKQLQSSQWAIPVNKDTPLWRKVE